MIYPSGFFIFPLRPGTKVPYADFSWPVLASNDPKKIEAWRRQYPGCNWAVACGPSRLVVFDVDIGGESWLADRMKDNPDFRNAPLVRTPKGGSHVYFRGVARSTVKIVHPHVDTRGEGGYVVLPGSVTVEGPNTAAGEYVLTKGSFTDDL